MTDDLKKLDEPWLVGYVPETGELVFAPIRGPQHENLVHLKSPAWVCKACRATLMRRDALVDYWGNVYHKSCFPYEEIKTKLRKELQDGAKATQVDARDAEVHPGLPDHGTEGLAEGGRIRGSGESYEGVCPEWDRDDDR